MSILKKISLLLFLAGVWFCGCVENPNDLGSAEMKGQMRYPRSGPGVLVVGDKVLVIGGYGAQRHAEFLGANLKRSLPSQESKAPHIRPHLHLLKSGNILILDHLVSEIYDPDTHSFRYAGKNGRMIHSRSAFTSVSLPDGRVLILGGYFDTGENIQEVNSIEVYNPSSNSFEEVNVLQSSILFEQHPILVGSEIYLITDELQVLAYDYKANTTKIVAELGFKRLRPKLIPSCELYEGKGQNIDIICNEDGGGQLVFFAMERDKKKPVLEFEQKVLANQIFISKAGGIYLVFLKKAKESSKNEVYSYSPGSKTLAFRGNLADDFNLGASSISLDNGSVVFIGGGDSSHSSKTFNVVRL